MVNDLKNRVLLVLMISIQLIFISCDQSAPINENDASIAEPADSLVESSDTANKALQTSPDLGRRVVNYAGTFLGTPYKEAGRDTSGFDCSGFVYYVFKKYQIDLPHSSRHMAQTGKQIAIEEAKEGDLIFFRGTDPTSTQVGHVGIVVSGSGEKIKFIHSSSAKSSPCVKLDSLEKPNYQKRFLMVKRVL